MRRGHDPYRARGLVVPQLDADAEPVTRLLHVHAHVDRYPPWVNAGGESMLRALLRRLAAAGHDVTVTTAVVSKPETVDGVEVRPARDARDVARAADVLVGHLLWTREVVELASRLNRPLVYLVHNDMQLGHWRLTPANVTILVWNSRWIEAKCSPRWDGPSVVVRPPVLVADYSVPRPAPEWVTLVNPNPDKGAATFYEVARARPDLTFATVGGGYGQQLRPPRGVTNVVRLAPTPRIAEEVYARTRVLFMPSRYESWGMAGVEALCSGIPVLAHPTPGLLEALDGGAIFADRDRPEQWIEALARLDDPEVYDAASVAARDRARDLDAQAVADLDRWEETVRRAAAASG